MRQLLELLPLLPLRLTAHSVALAFLRIVLCTLVEELLVHLHEEL